MTALDDLHSVIHVFSDLLNLILYFCEDLVNVIHTQWLVDDLTEEGSEPDHVDHLLFEV